MTRRPPHLSAALAAVVAAGGALGTGARYVLTTALPHQQGWPVATFTENVVGAFLLGVLLEVLVRRGLESRGGRLVRLGLGTGFLGGFTTFSAVAIEIDRLLASGAAGTALTYAVATLVLGLVAALAGVALAARQHRWRQGTLPSGPDSAEREPPQVQDEDR